VGFVGTVLFFGIAVVLFLGIPGGSAGYFTNVAFFVSMPVVVSYFVDRCAGVKIRGRYYAGWSMGVLLALSWNAISAKREMAWANASQVRANADKGREALIDSLERLRGDAKAKIVYRLVGSADGLAGFARCSARPFIFPAVTERAWIGVINPVPGKCQLSYYGYENYGVHDSGPVAREPVVPKEADIVPIAF
jgi:hypothetical protein